MEKIPTIASSFKGFTDPNQLFCCCGKETSFSVSQSIQAASAWGKKKKKKLHLEIFLEMPPQSCLQNWSLGGSQPSGQIF